jgi:DNA polymerase-4
VTLRLRFDDFSRATRSYTLPRPTSETQAILETARWLFAVSLPTIQQNGLTLVGVTVSNLDDDRAVQLAFRGRYALDLALDDIRERFGADAVKRAVLLGRDTGLVVPLLPD